MNGNKAIRIALTKGRLEKDTVGLFEKMGFDVTELKEKGRRLILNIPGENMEVVLAKAADVITYVEHGVCDLGVVGKDTILEHGSSFYELLDLGFGKCRFALAAKKGGDFYGGYNTKTIATKYPNVTRAFFDDKNMDVRIIKIEGSVELAPLVGLSDGIVDIVETGFRQNRIIKNRRTVNNGILGIIAVVVCIKNLVRIGHRQQRINVPIILKVHIIHQHEVDTALMPILI
jgi:ATP phosphoribosyltransferase